GPSRRTGRRKAASKASTPAVRAPDAELEQVILTRGVVEIIPQDEFVEALRFGRKLRLKLGLDPSKPDLHIGHGVLLRKLRQLQELGHQVVLIVGDWTAQIGDPSGQSAMRTMLTAEEVRANAETYMRQFFHVVDRKKTEVRWQTEWFGKFTLEDVVRLAARFTVAQMLQREDFRQRFEARQPLGIHELLYPLLQAYDSVAIDADVEFGGSDQLFNLLVGRELQSALGGRPQSVFVMRLLVGTDGTQKMSKTVGNTVDFEDPPNEQYGKVMSVPDSALLDYLELATDIPDEELAYIRKQLEERTANPMEIKKRLAREIVTQFHGEAAAQQAEAEWSAVYQQEREPQDVEEFRMSLSKDFVVQLGPTKPLSSGTIGAIIMQRRHSLPHVLKAAGVVPSVSEARRLLRERAVRQRSADVWKEVDSPAIELKDGSLLRIGPHRFLRIVDADR
ncbi:MAG: tyrosine--tRNA ligase, partial [Dehalococcoidia bacterium]|nr:tyrosine--tRNA ligase [Dehalococcoidia bacterium]